MSSTSKPTQQNSTKPSTFDSKKFRSALGQFATGVTIVTTLDSHGNPIGMTASSFNSVSIDPALVLWSIDKNAFSYDVFMQTEYFAIHVLTAEQQDLSNHFAQSQDDKFSGIEKDSGLHGLPILKNTSACFQCQIEHRYPGGDHTILVGKVLDFSADGKAPLLFHAGQYAGLTQD